jgi:hypothetical protein
VAKDEVFQVATATLLPVVALASMIMSLEELLKRLFGILI